MAISVSGSIYHNAFSTTSIATQSGLAVVPGQLVFISIGTSDDVVYCTGLTDTAGNSYTVRTAILLSGSETLAWCVATQGNANNIFTATFNSATSCNKFIGVVVVNPGSGKTFVFDVSGSGKSAWKASPLTTSAADTTGAEEIAICGFHKHHDYEEATGWQIPAGVAAILEINSPSDNPGSNKGSNYVFYKLFSEPTAGVSAQCTSVGSSGYEAEWLAFKTQDAGGESPLPSMIARYRRRWI